MSQKFLFIFTFLEILNYVLCLPTVFNQGILPERFYLNTSTKSESVLDNVPKEHEENEIRCCDDEKFLDKNKELHLMLEDDKFNFMEDTAEASEIIENVIHDNTAALNMT